VYVRGIPECRLEEIVQHRDPEGHYASLNVSPDASREEILLSYRLLKQAYRERGGKMNSGAIQAAYEVLGDAESKAGYDRMNRPVAPAVTSRTGGVKFNTTGLLMSLVAVLLVVVAVVHGPEMRYSMSSFRPGDRLYQQVDGQFLGTVTAYEAKHMFYNGIRSKAYLLRGNDPGEEMWYPAGDLARIADVR
jgi:curved DNA-binding protein CbpA